MKNTPDVPNAGAIRAYLELPPVTFDQAVALVEGGSCVLCQESGHPYSGCPALRLSNVTHRLAVQAFMRAFNDKKKDPQGNAVV